MSVLRPRNRTIYFRLSQEEFGRLFELCGQADGPRSVSELSRAAVQKLIQSHQSQNGEAQDLPAILNRLEELNRKVEWLVQAVGAQQAGRETPSTANSTSDVVETE